MSCLHVAYGKPACKALSGSVPSGVASLVCSKGCADTSDFLFSTVSANPDQIRIFAVSLGV